MHNYVMIILFIVVVFGFGVQNIDKPKHEEKSNVIEDNKSSKIGSKRVPETKDSLKFNDEMFNGLCGNVQYKERINSQLEFPLTYIPFL